MAIKVSGERGGTMAEPNIVPLIDVLLVLLIIFMVITPLTPKGLDTLVPQPNPNAKEDPNVLARTIVIQVERGSLRINQDPVTMETLGPRLEEIFKTRAEKVAFVKGDSNLQFADVAKVIDIAKGSGVDKIGLITAKIEAGQ